MAPGASAFHHEQAGIGTAVQRYVKVAEECARAQLLQLK
jgi:hypothetical protein